ncbi:MAG: hypothetical protein ACRD2N_01105, partial [Vicinamibacterales bacterium]
DQISQVFSVKATARPEAGQDNIEANEAEHIDRLVGLRLRLVRSRRELTPVNVANERSWVVESTAVIA